MSVLNQRQPGPGAVSSTELVEEKALVLVVVAIGWQTDWPALGRTGFAAQTDFAPGQIGSVVDHHVEAGTELAQTGSGNPVQTPEVFDRTDPGVEVLQRGVVVVVRSLVPGCKWGQTCEGESVPWIFLERKLYPDHSWHTAAVEPCPGCHACQSERRSTISVLRTAFPACISGSPVSVACIPAFHCEIVHVLWLPDQIHALSSRNLLLLEQTQEKHGRVV